MGNEAFSEWNPPCGRQSLSLFGTQGRSSRFSAEIKKDNGGKDMGRQRKENDSRLMIVVFVLAVVCLLAGGLYIDTFYGGGRLKTSSGPVLYGTTFLEF